MSPQLDRERTVDSAKVAAWLVLAGAGGITMVYNIWHATHAGHMPLGLALLYGFGPVFVAALLSHIVAEFDSGWFLKTVTFAAMIGAMSMSIGATASVIGPTAGPVLRWVFGAVLDTAALVALRVILAGRKRKTEAADALTAAEAKVREASAQAARIEAELEAERAAHASAQQETAEALARVEALAAKAASISAHKPRTPSTANARVSADGDLTTELRALMELRADRELCKPRMGGELARRLGVSAATGRRLHSRLTHQGALNETLAKSLTERSE